MYANSGSKHDIVSQETEAVKKQAFTTGQWSKTYLKIHHELLQETWAEAFEMALKISRLKSENLLVEPSQN